MTAITSAANGNWGDTGTWTGGVVPGDGDTVTLNHNVTVTDNRTVGSSPATGGTAAIAMGNVAGKTLTINDGVTLTLKGDISFNAASGRHVVSVGAGSSLVFLPASGQEYKFNNVGASWSIDLNGTSGARATLKTDLSSGGSAAYMTQVNFLIVGLRTATYADFIDMGQSAAKPGVRSYIELASSATAPNVSITNCTFTRSHYYLDVQHASWDGNFTFQNNTFASSVNLSGSGINNCAIFNFGGTGTSGTWAIDLCGFDKAIYFPNYRARLSVTNSAFPNHYYLTGSWASDTKFNNNFIYDSYANNTAGVPFGGSVRDIYLRGTDLATSNIHYATGPTGDSTLDGLIFEAASGLGGASDGVFIPALGAGKTCTVIRCLSLPGAGEITSCLSMTSGALVAIHNTMHSDSEGGVVSTGEGTASYAGQVSLCSSNLVTKSSAGTNVYAYYDRGTAGVDVITSATKNAFWNANSATCKYNTSTSQANVLGYKNATVALNSPFPNSQIGSGDITLTANPYVDHTRNLATWGATQGADGTEAGAIAVLVANPALIAQANTGLIAWVRAGFKVTTPSLKDAGHDGVTIGAMEYQATGGGRGMGSKYGHTLLRP